jgi:hypothetical protein
MRKLATIQTISQLLPIEGADKIELCLLENLSWQCVVKKGEFVVGEKIIYVEIDSVMPEKPEYEFLRERKFRIRTIKLRKTLSQGLVLPITEGDFDLSNLPIGTDVTERLGITKYLSPSERYELEQTERKLALEKNKLKKFMMRYSWFRRLFLSKKQKNGWPYWVAKTDEERIQNLSWDKFYEQFKDHEIYITEKIDYQSVTFTGKMLPRVSGWLGKILPKKYKFIVCSRNLVNNAKNSLYWQIAKKYNIEKILRENPTLTIQGEQGDTKVQGNKYGITEPTMWIFNIIDHEKGYHYNWGEIVFFCKKYNLNHVPFVGYMKLSELGSTPQEILEFSENKSTIANIPREGVVIRCIENGKKVFSFKAINNNFLLKYE